MLRPVCLQIVFEHLKNEETLEINWQAAQDQEVADFELPGGRRGASPVFLLLMVEILHNLIYQKYRNPGSIVHIHVPWALA